MNLKRQFLTSPEEMAQMVKVALKGYSREQLELMEQLEQQELKAKEDFRVSKELQEQTD